MKEHCIITISRQYGSGGRQIGRALAEKRNIAYYDKEIMEQTAIDLGLAPDFFQDDNLTHAGLYSLGIGHGSWKHLSELSLNAAMLERACALVENIADKEDAVIVGRCADWMLKERKNVLKVYVCAALPDRIARAVEYGIPEKKARHFIQETDARRAAFYEYNTSCRWGDPALFDLVIDTSKMSLEEAVDRIEEHIHKKEA